MDRMHVQSVSGHAIHCHAATIFHNCSAYIKNDRCSAQVPKMLGALRSEWAPEAFLISFKLETDDRILISKVCPAPLTMPLKFASFSPLLVESYIVLLP